MFTYFLFCDIIIFAKSRTLKILYRYCIVSELFYFNRGDKNFMRETETKTKLNTVAFVDYEYWYYGMMNQYNTVPAVDEWVSDLRQRGKLYEIIFFGDFTKSEMQREKTKLRNVSNNIVDCSAGDGVIKDYSDFIMLDHIYQKLILQENIEQFVLFTGDGHFQSVAAFLKNFNDKTVGVYAVKGLLSPLLAGAADWYEEISSARKTDRFAEIPPIIYKADGREEFAAAEDKNALREEIVVDIEKKADNFDDDIFDGKNNGYFEKTISDEIKTEIKDAIISNFRWVKSKGFDPSFMKTVNAVCNKHWHFEDSEVIRVLSDMIEKGFVKRLTITTDYGTEYKILEVDWDHIDEYYF